MNERVHLERAGNFVELQQHGARIEHTHGRIGDPAKLRYEERANAPEATQVLLAHVRRLERKGFVVGFHHSELEAAIVGDPADPAPRLVFADWLLERRDPRGELITRMASGVEFDDHLARFPFHLAPPWMATCKLEWHLGFVRTVTFDGAWFDFALLRRMFRHPSLMVVEELRLSGLRYVHAPNAREALSRRPASLRRIDARGIPSLEALVRELPGLEV